jgi:hypothetical protein
MRMTVKIEIHGSHDTYGEIEQCIQISCGEISMEDSTVEK